MNRNNPNQFLGSHAFSIGFHQNNPSPFDGRYVQRPGLNALAFGNGPTPLFRPEIINQPIIRPQNLPRSGSGSHFPHILRKNHEHGRSRSPRHYSRTNPKRKERSPSPESPKRRRKSRSPIRR